MQNSKPPFRADHVGSLLRPPELARARAEHKAGRLSAANLRKAEDAVEIDSSALDAEGVVDRMAAIVAERTRAS